MVELKVICLSEERIKSSVEREFPYVERTEAVDYRRKDISDIENSMVKNFIRKGRKHHYECATKGCVGLTQTNIQILEQASSDILLMESDCTVSDGFREFFQTTIQMHPFEEVIIFGARRYDHKKKKTPYKLKKLEDIHGMHCVYYRKDACKKVSTMLKQNRLPFQLDALISVFAVEDGLRVLIVPNTKTNFAVQQFHKSTIQEFWGSCFLCDTDNNKAFRRHCLFLFSIILNVVLMAILLNKTSPLSLSSTRSLANARYL